MIIVMKMITVFSIMVMFKCPYHLDSVDITFSMHFASLSYLLHASVVLFSSLVYSAATKM